MGKVYPELDERLRKFIGRQSVFFVATAPCLSADGEGGHVNVSPKGYRESFAVLGALQHGTGRIVLPGAPAWEELAGQNAVSIDGLPALDARSALSAAEPARRGTGTGLASG